MVQAAILKRDELEEIIDNILLSLRQAISDAKVSTKQGSIDDPKMLSPSYLRTQINELLEPEIRHYSSIYPETDLGDRFKGMESLLFSYSQQLSDVAREHRLALRKHDFTYQAVGALFGVFIPTLGLYLTHPEQPYTMFRSWMDFTGFFGIDFVGVICGVAIGGFFSNIFHPKTLAVYKTLNEKIGEEMLTAFYKELPVTEPLMTTA